MRALFGSCVGAVAIAIGFGVPIAGADEKEKARFDPAVLNNLPDNTWVNLGLPYRGGHEVPAIFDSANQLFFKYGGCVDHSPRINFEGSKRPNETYGNSCWAVSLASGEWKMLRPRDMSFPMNRPSNGCSRSYAYDSRRKLIWMYGGISNGGGGGDAWDMWTYDGAADTFKKRETQNRPPKGDGNGGDVFVYDSARDRFIMPRGLVTWIYDPNTNVWEARKTSSGPVPVKPGQGHYSSMVFDPVSKCVIFPRAAATGKNADSLIPDMPKERWQPSEKGYAEYEFQTWSYDPDANRWTNLKLATQPTPTYRKRFGLVYDSKNRAILMIAGSSNTWDKREENFNDVWVFDPAKNTWTEPKPEGKKPIVLARDCRHCAYDPLHNVTLFLPASPTGTLWAYRYRK